MRPLLLPALLLGSPVLGAQDPAAVGQWSDPFALPLIAIHQAMLPDFHATAHRQATTETRRAGW